MNTVNYNPKQGAYRSNDRGGYQNVSSAEKEFNKEPLYNPNWIKKGSDDSMIEFADKKGKFMSKELTNSKIRSIYGEIKRIQMGFEENKSSFFLLKPKVAYAYGRDNKNEGLHLFKLIFDRAYQDVDINDKKTYLNFCNLIEAILAYHKAYGGKD